MSCCRMNGRIQLVKQAQVKLASWECGRSVCDQPIGRRADRATLRGPRPTELLPVLGRLVDAKPLFQLTTLGLLADFLTQHRGVIP